MCNTTNISYVEQINGYFKLYEDGNKKKWLKMEKISFIGFLLDEIFSIFFYIQNSDIRNIPFSSMYIYNLMKKNIDDFLNYDKKTLILIVNLPNEGVELIKKDREGNIINRDTIINKLEYGNIIDNIDIIVCFVGRQVGRQVCGQVCECVGGWVCRLVGGRVSDSGRRRR